MRGKRGECEGEMPPGMAPRIAASAVVGISWLIFLIAFLWFYAGDLGIYKSIAVFLISILVVAAILAPIWICWGIKTARVWEKKTTKRKRKK